MRYCLLAMWLVACGSEGNPADISISETSDDTSADTTPSENDTNDDTIPADTSISETNPDIEVSDEAGATTYCERSVEMFCGFYVRCGRMVAADVDECRRVFLETCNARYEPLYADLEARGDLYLSVAGLERCADHLETVVCERQIFDLDGCSDVWVGRHQVGERCGPGLESFVCAEDSVCVLGLDFCGTCKARVASGCDLENRCADTEQCIDGTCVARPQGGEPCTAAGPSCVVGADCVEGTCRGPEVVKEGEGCGGNRRCPYRSQCAGGTCVRTELVGAVCGGDVGCASGFCAATGCEPLGQAGDECGGGWQCVSGRCANPEATCQPIGWSCLP